MSNPYSGLDSRAFWKSAVADGNPLAPIDIYRPKFCLSAKDRIATAGSCFAQHIGRRVKDAGFCFQDFEPPPPYLSAEDQRQFGYGLYSARYGNIYTVRQLIQLMRRAFGQFTPVEDRWMVCGRIYDPFRPTIEPSGFRDETEFESMRADHFRAVRAVFIKSDVFVFTLGLTEAWVSAVDGAVFPVCPGTVVGAYAPEKHVFHNFSFLEIYSDLRQILAILKAINPTMRLLLTVSPVPLTATASGQHVMVATTHSKATLRAAAGAIAAEYPNVDYFPSFEIITSAAARSMFYESNLRTVTVSGVDAVMAEFFRWNKPVVCQPEEPPQEEIMPEALVCEESSLSRFQTCSPPS